MVDLEVCGGGYLIYLRYSYIYVESKFIRSFIVKFGWYCKFSRFLIKFIEFIFV